MFIIALSKDQIIVWLATSKNEYSQQICLLATPYSRMKDFSKRLESLYAKKVKGNRLDNLDSNLIDCDNAPFVLEYTTSLFRISDLTGFGAVFPLKANFAQTQAFNSAADFLKERFANCQFMIRYDTKNFRSSTINNWLKKSTLNAKLDPITLETSLELQSATLLAALLIDEQMDHFTDPQIHEITQRVKANITMSSRWQKVDTCTLYLALFNPQWADLLKLIFKQAPRLMREGLVEKWLKKQIDVDYLKTVLKCLDLEDGVDLVLTSSMNRLSIEYEKYLEKLKKEQYKYDQDEFMDWIEIHDQVAKTKLHAPIDLGFDQWQQRIEVAMTKWIEHPCQNLQADTIYLVALDEKVALFRFACLNYTKQLFDQYQLLESQEENDSKQELLLQRIQDSIVLETGYLKDLEKVIIDYSAQSILPNLYCSSSMYHLVMKIELMQNRFIPCYVMNHQERTWIHQIKDLIDPLCFEHMEIKKDELGMQERPSEMMPAEDLHQSNLCKANQEEQTKENEERERVWPKASKQWFKTAVYQKIDAEQLQYLAKSNFSFSQIRLVGFALARGLQPKVLKKMFHHPDLIEEIVMPYLFNSQKQKWFKQQSQFAKRPLHSLYFNPNWSLSKLEAIAKLEQSGLNEQWLKTNLKGNMTIAQIERLATIYPYGTLPQQYAMTIPIPTSVEQWLIDQASQNHPNCSKEELHLQLARWNEHLFQEVIDQQNRPL